MAVGAVQMTKGDAKVELTWSSKHRGPTLSHLDWPELVHELEQHGSTGRTGGNILFWGDNLLAMQNMIDTGQASTIDLVYLDPPFFTGLDFNTKTSSGARKPAYMDSWKKMGLDGYLTYMHDRLKLVYDLLKDGGTLYIHLDWHVVHYVKILLDEIFGYENFRNQIIWKRLTYKQTQVKAYGVLHDVILYYTKGKNYTWNDVRAEYDEARVRKYFCWVETVDGENIKLTKKQLDGTEPMPAGRRFALNPLINPNPNRPHLTYEFLGFTKVWKYTKEKMLDYYARGIVFKPSPNVLPQKKQFLDESAGMKLNDIFLDIGSVMGGSNERMDYDTQKPEKLLRRLISVSSNPGDVVADFFSGSGTSLVAAQALGRKWIGCELSAVGIQATATRLVPAGPAREHAAYRIVSIDHPVLSGVIHDPDAYVPFITSLYTQYLHELGSKFDIKKPDSIQIVMPDVELTKPSIEKLVNELAMQQAETVDIIGSSWRLSPADDLAAIGTSLNCDVRCVQAPPMQAVQSLLVGSGIDVSDIVSDPASISGKVKDLFHPLPSVGMFCTSTAEGTSISIARYSVALRVGDANSLRNGCDLVDHVSIGLEKDSSLFEVKWERSGETSCSIFQPEPLEDAFNTVQIVDKFGTCSRWCVKSC
jgi:DNA modification methylase